MSNTSSSISHGTRELLSSRLGFILIAAGCAIGLGNVWRFPYITGQNGGAIFVGIYLLCLFALGIPCVMLELSLGRASGKSVAKAFDLIEKTGTKWHLAKYPMMLGPYFLMSYYTVLTGWLLYYVFSIARGDFSDLASIANQSADSLAVIKEGVSAKFLSLLADPATMISCSVIIITLAILVCARGVQKGVEFITKPMMLLLLCLLTGLAIYAITLDGAMEGIKYYLYPDIEKARQVGWAKVIYEALNQAFFSLSVGQGSLLIFGSYIKKNKTLATESMIIVALDTFVAIMAGLIIFPVCFSFGISPDSGPTLLFESLLNVFCVMEYGRVIGTIFFVFMFFAAFTTVIAVIESIIALTIEHFNTTRRFAVFLNFVIILLSSIPCVLGFNVWQDVQPLGAGSSILDFEDFIVSNNILPFGALFFVIFAVFGWGLKNCFDEINTGTGIKLSNKFKYYFMAILPLVIGVILVYGYINKFS